MKLLLRSIGTTLPLLAILLATGCKKDGPTIWRFTPANTYNEIQTALINMADGDIIEFSAGTFVLNQYLSVEGKTGIIIRGAGMTETILDFNGQIAGAYSIYAANNNMIKFQDFTVKDPIADGIKAKDSDGITFLRTRVMHSTPADVNNGAYGLYPVTSKNVLVDDCSVSGCSDAGIYVGQSEIIIVRNCDVFGNVAGLEIENCRNADVYGNHCHDNTGGLLVFDLPTLPVIKNGHTCRVYSNLIEHNDLINFAPPGSSVANVPSGTGIMLLASNTVEVFDNDINYNNILGIGVVSYNTLVTLAGAVYEDAAYDPDVNEVHIHDNRFIRDNNFPADNNDMGDLLQALGSASDIVFDGYASPVYNGAANAGICIHDNGTYTFSNIDVPHSFNGLTHDATPHDCVQDALPMVVVTAPE